MINFKIIIYLFISTIFFISCKPTIKKDISFKNDKINYMGRIGETDSCKEIYWSGSSITFKFDGRIMAAVLKDETGNNYYNVIIDGKVESVLQPDTIKKIYVLTPLLDAGVHTVSLFKRTEWTQGKTMFYGIQIERNAELLPSETKKRFIEFYGNSITAGYAVDDTTGKDSPEGTNTNCYNSYAAITARHFNANFNCIVRSGIGIMISWFPMIIGEMYYRLDPANNESYWNFNKEIPDIVVINLLQNDSWLINMPEHEQFKRRFGNTPPTKEFIINSYKNFVESIQEKYPNTKIICMLGNMDITKENSPWITYVKDAVALLNNENISTLFVPYKNTKGHPNIMEQNTLADTLTSFIETKFNWSVN